MAHHCLTGDGTVEDFVDPADPGFPKEEGRHCCARRLGGRWRIKHVIGGVLQGWALALSWPSGNPKATTCPLRHYYSLQINFPSLEYLSLRLRECLIMGLSAVWYAQYSFCLSDFGMDVTVPRARML